MVTIRSEGDFVLFIHPHWMGDYYIPIKELTKFEDGNYTWFIHMATKGWFTESHFWKLLGIARKHFPVHNFDNAIWQSSQQFYKRNYF